MNSVVLAGRLTADPDLRTTSNGIEVTSFCIAVKKEFAKQGEQECDFINVTAWRKTAAFINKYFSKGDGIVLKGRIQTGSYQTNTGEKRYTTDVLAENVEFPQGKKGSGESQSAESTTAYPNVPAAGIPQSNSVPIPESGNSQEFPLDDDLPF